MKLQDGHLFPTTFPELFDTSQHPLSTGGLGEAVNTLTILHEIIDAVDESGIEYLMSGYDNDFGLLVNTMVDTIRDTCNGGRADIPYSEYCPRLGGVVEETLRKESLAYFIASVLPDFEMNWHHLEWCNYEHLYQKLCILAARGIGKSYFWSFAYPLWKMYRYMKESLLAPVPKRFTLSSEGILFTYEQNLGEYLLEKIKAEIESNPILNETLYPGKKPEKWTQSEIITKNGAFFYVKSYGSASRGRHPGYIILDDFLVDNVLYSKTQRDKISDYIFSVIDNMPVKGGSLRVVGTPFHSEDSYGQMKKKERRTQWWIFEYPAIFPDGILTWPRMYSMKELETKRKTQGQLIFSREILCKPITSSSSIFPYDILVKAFYRMEDYVLVTNIYSFPKKFKKIVGGVDLAISSSVGADYTVFMTWGIDEEDNMWLLNLFREKGLTYQNQVNHLKRIYHNFKHDIIMVETNQYQMVFYQDAQREGIPVKPHNTSTDKHHLKDGLPGIAILFENGKIKFPRGNEESRSASDLIVSEFASIAYTDDGKLESTTQHDDCSMCTWQSVLAARWGGGLSISFL